MDSEQTSLNIGQLLGVIRRRGLWVILCFVIVAGAAYWFSKHETKKYVATASLVFSNDELNQELAGLAPITSYEDPLAQENTDVRLVESGRAAARTATKLGHGLTAAAVSADIAVKAETESNIVDVTVTSTSPVLAAKIANTYTHAFVGEQRRSNDREYMQARALVEKQLAALPAGQRYSATGIALQERAEELAALAVEPGDVQVAQVATAPTLPSSPRVSRDTALGAILGLLLGLGIAFLLEHLDRRIREPSDLEAVYRVPLLGVVPQSAALDATKRKRGRALSPGAIEAFQLIRAHLRYFNVDRELRTLLIGSAAPGDGKTTVARHLAAASARVGSRVLLLEADLRRPTLARQLGIDRGPGIIDVLIGSVSLVEATQSLELDGSDRGVSSPHMLDVIVAGAMLPPNPGELIESHALQVLLEEARSVYDLVVIDTPPLGPVSDAFSLLTKVDGVIIVGRLAHNRRDLAQRLRATLAEAGAPLLGVIANGLKERALSRESYAYDYAQKGDQPNNRADAPTSRDVRGLASDADDLTAAAPRPSGTPG